MNLESNDKQQLIRLKVEIDEEISQLKLQIKEAKLHLHRTG